MSSKWRKFYKKEILWRKFYKKEILWRKFYKNMEEILSKDQITKNASALTSER